MNIPERHEIILLLIDLNGEPFRGKTNLHKSIYLTKEMDPDLGLPFEFKAHFYGPFSQQVSEEIDILENCGLIETNQVDMGRKDSFEVKQYIFKLTNAGSEAAKILREGYPEFCDRFDKLLQKIRDTRFHQNTKILATAAKVRLILTAESQPMSSGNITAKAKELGWNINPGEINSALEVLQKTGLVRIIKAN
jgi:uncharacterized protein YwgA